ncbi:MAG: hypothetical protein RI988_719 [Pseudomonadota bacterium]
MTRERIPPASVVILTFGGVNATARAIGVHQSCVSRWQRTGLVPAHHQQRVLRVAWRHQLELTALDVVFGR